MTAQRFKRLIFGSRESASKSISVPEDCFEVDTGADARGTSTLMNAPATTQCWTAGRPFP